MEIIALETIIHDQSDGKGACVFRDYSVAIPGLFLGDPGVRPAAWELMCKADAKTKPTSTGYYSGTFWAWDYSGHYSGTIP